MSKFQTLVLKFKIKLITKPWIIILANLISIFSLRLAIIGWPLIVWDFPLEQDCSISYWEDTTQDLEVSRSQRVRYAEYVESKKKPEDQFRLAHERLNELLEKARRKKHELEEIRLFLLVKKHDLFLASLNQFPEEIPMGRKAFEIVENLFKDVANKLEIIERRNPSLLQSQDGIRVFITEYFRANEKLVNYFQARSQVELYDPKSLCNLVLAELTAYNNFYPSAKNYEIMLHLGTHIQMKSSCYIERLDFYALVDNDNLYNKILQRYKASLEYNENPN